MPDRGAAGEFGCMLVAPDEYQVLKLDEALQERIKAYGVEAAKR